MPSKSNYYADAEPTEASAPPEEETAPEQEQETPGGTDSATAELPKTVLGGKTFKPGEEVVLEVVQVMENSVLVRYASEKGGGEEESAGAEAPAEGGNPGGNPGGSYY